jgi:hypothetical protein
MKHGGVGCARNSERNALRNVIRLLMLVDPVEANSLTPKQTRNTISNEIGNNDYGNQADKE